MRISDWSSDVCSSDLRRLLEVALQQVDVSRWLRTNDHRLIVGIGIERRRIAATTGQTAGTAAADDQRLAIVGERVGQPDIGCTALEQAQTATQLGVVFGVERIVETKARLEQVQIGRAHV